MKNKFCINCGKPATCEHHIVPIVLGGFDIPSNKAPLCDKCHGLIHGVKFEKGGISHSELIKRGMQRKKEAIKNGEKYTPRHSSKHSDQIGRPSLRLEDIPENFVIVYTNKEYTTITDLANKMQMSRTTVYRYIKLLEKN